jgi:aminoglycoside phosphotransferase (APT) family kinase protein
MSELRITEDVRDDIHKRLTSVYPEMGPLELGYFKQIHGGATQTMYSFNLLSESNTVPLTLRVFTQDQAEGAEKEFLTIQRLYDKGLKVPRPYFIALDSTALGRPYIVIEYIYGPMLSDVLMALKSGSRFDYLIQEYTNNMAVLHSLDWSEQFLFLDSREIHDNPEMFSYRELARPMEIIERHSIKDLLPVVEWMQDHAVTTTEACLIHGDYHGMNIIVRDEKELVTIDWNSARIGDYRFDLAYSIITLLSANLDVEQKIVQQYERVTGQEVEKLDYFKALSSIWNLLRIYSCLFDYSVMGETDETAQLFIEEYHDYSRFTVETVQQVTRTSLSRLLDALSKVKKENKT